MSAVQKLLVSRACPSGSQGISRCSCFRLKYPSSYPDFMMHPFFTTTLSLPEKRKLRSSSSVVAESSLESWILRRNSVNVFSSTIGSVSFIIRSPRPETQNLRYFDFGTGYLFSQQEYCSRNIT